MIINPECHTTFIVLTLMVIGGFLCIEYLNIRVFKRMRIMIDSLRDRIQMKNETIELLRAKLKEVEK